MGRWEFVLKVLFSQSLTLLYTQHTNTFSSCTHHLSYYSGLTASLTIIDYSLYQGPKIVSLFPLSLKGKLSLTHHPFREQNTSHYH